MCVWGSAGRLGAEQAFSTHPGQATRHSAPRRQPPLPGKWGHKLPLYSHKNNVDNWEETKDENAVMKTDSPALVDASLDPV